MIMPVINIDLWEGRDKDTKAKLIVSVTKAVTESIGCPADAVQVILNEVPKENWGLAGKQASDI